MLIFTSSHFKFNDKLAAQSGFQKRVHISQQPSTVSLFILEDNTASYSAVYHKPNFPKLKISKSLRVFA